MNNSDELNSITYIATLHRCMKNEIEKQIFSNMIDMKYQFKFNLSEFVYHYFELYKTSVNELFTFEFAIFLKYMSIIEHLY